jgi:glycosyltransferase involved in cell wall biosynthesis
MKRNLGIPEGHKVVGLVANFRPMKRHQTFIDAAERIIRRRDDVSFLLLGKNAIPGDPRKKVEELVASRGLAHRVHFSHAMGNMHEFLGIMDVGVNCSEGEGLSNAIMEYMAARVPCVVSASGGNPDLITDDVHGYTFALGDDEALARQICRLLDDEPARRRMTENAYAKVHSEMSIEAMLDHFARYYTALAEGDAKPEGELRKAAETETR